MHFTHMETLHKLHAYRQCEEYLCASVDSVSPEDAVILLTCLPHCWRVDDWCQFSQVFNDHIVEQRLICGLQTIDDEKFVYRPLLHGDLQHDSARHSTYWH